jgi:multiple sugar transport system substrate-binding protein
MKKFVALLLLLAMLMSIAFTGCGAKKEQPSGEPKKEEAAVEKQPEASKSQSVTLRVAWWGNQERHDKTLKVIDMYKQKNPHVSFEAEYTSWDGYWDKLGTQAAANNLPDIIQHDYAFLGQWAEKNLLEDLTPYTKSGALDVSDIGENFLSGGMLNEKLYGVSLGTNALSLVYDPDVFAKAGMSVPTSGWTWKDYEENISKVYEKTKIQTPIPLLKDPKFLLEYLVREQGKSLYSADGTSLGFDDEKIILDMLTSVVKLVKSGVYINPEVQILQKTNEDDYMTQGKAAVGLYWSNFFVALSDIAKKELGITSVPVSVNASAKGLYLKPSQFFAVTKSSSNKEEAAKFISYFVNDMEANKVLMADRGVPVASKVRNELKSLVAPAVRQTFEYIDLAEENSRKIDPPEPVGAAEVTKLFKALYEEVVFQKTTPENAAARFMKEANEILAKNKK